MKFPVTSADEIGVLIRAVRKAQRLRQDDAAGSLQVSESFLTKVERGDTSVNWGKLFHVLDGMGIRLVADLPEVSTESVHTEKARAKVRAARVAKARQKRRSPTDQNP